MIFTIGTVEHEGVNDKSIKVGTPSSEFHAHNLGFRNSDSLLNGGKNKDMLHPIT